MKIKQTWNQTNMDTDTDMNWYLNFNFEIIKQTWKVAECNESLLTKLYLALGTDAWIMQVSDSHMLRLSESPTNIIFFPLHLSRKSKPLNLHKTKIAH